MSTIPVMGGEAQAGQPPESDANGHFIRVIVADTQAIFRAGLRKIFALEDDIRVVGQADTLGQALSAVKKFAGDVLILEAALAGGYCLAMIQRLHRSAHTSVTAATI